MLYTSPIVTTNLTDIQRRTQVKALVLLKD
jgi:hypothetical protein